METNDIKTKSDFKQIIFLVLIVIFILLLIFTMITLIKNKDIITKDPLVYGMQVHNFSYCSCLDNSGKYWESSKNGFISKT